MIQNPSVTSGTLLKYWSARVICPPNLEASSWLRYGDVSAVPPAMPQAMQGDQIATAIIVIVVSASYRR
jgi:hypothetical protein